MQATMVAATEKAGPAVLPGARVVGLLPEMPCGLCVRLDARDERIYRARLILIVGADERNSMCLGGAVASARIEGQLRSVSSRSRYRSVSHGSESTDIRRQFER